MPAAGLRNKLHALYSLSVLAGRAVLLALLIWLLLTQIWDRQTVRLPDLAGPYAVGRALYDWKDETRPDPFSQNPAIRRELVVWVWYPAPPAPGAAPAGYLPGNWGQIIQQRNNPFLSQDLSAIRAHAVADASLVPAPTPYPILIMSAGFGLLPTDLTVLAEQLASRGYVVVGIAPTFIAPVVVFPDGRLVEQAAAVTAWGNESSPPAIKTYGDKLVTIWAQDTSFVIDQLTQLDHAPGGRFSSRLDLARIGVFGHSIGGAVALQACHMDNRCQAGIDLDGALYGEVVSTGLQQPFMFIQSEPPASCDKLCAQQASEIQSVYNRLPHGAYELTITGFRHFNFTDYAVEYSPLAKIEGLLGTIGGQRGLLLSSDYIAAFFDKYLRSLPAPLLDGPSPAYPEVQLKRR